MVAKRGCWRISFIGLFEKNFVPIPLLCQLANTSFFTISKTLQALHFQNCNAAKKKKKKIHDQLAVWKKLPTRFHIAYIVSLNLEVFHCFSLLNLIQAFNFFIFSTLSVFLFFFLSIKLQKIIKINIKSMLITKNIHCMTRESSIFKLLAWTRIKKSFPNPSLAKFVMFWMFEYFSLIGKHFILMWLPQNWEKKITYQNCSKRWKHCTNRQNLRT